MRRFVWRCLAISLLVGLAASAETRPQYGGTLHVMMREALTSLDPADGSQTDSFARRSVTMLMFDTLLESDEQGRIKASLATSWQSVPGNTAETQRWQFELRPGVKFQDGTPLTAAIVTTSLATANPSWKVTAANNSVIIDLEIPAPELLAELTMPRNGILKRSADGQLSGTGPFHVTDWQAGKKLTLAADEEYWRGRPFLDGVEIEMGKSYRDQTMALDLGRADLIEVAVELTNRISQEGRRVVSSQPVELLALVFARDTQSPEDKLLRDALALSVERSSIRSVLLQGAGQPAGGLLPTWLSGYGFVFPTGADLSKARREREQVSKVTAWTFGYDGNDPLSHLLAERITFNAKDAGLTLQLTTAMTADLRLMRIPLVTGDPWIALANVAAAVGSPLKNDNGAAEELYAAEESVIGTQRVIPLFHLPVSYAAATTLKNWTVRPDGNWSVVDAWIGSSRP